jgi:hypothetical protein
MTRSFARWSAVALAALAIAARLMVGGSRLLLTIAVTNDDPICVVTSVQGSREVVEALREPHRGRGISHCAPSLLAPHFAVAQHATAERDTVERLFDSSAARLDEVTHDATGPPRRS